MKWQEYQEAVARLYEQAEGVGTLRRDALIPDRVTGQNRQVDVLLEIEAKGHIVRVLIDAKFRADSIDVKVVEEVLALAESTGAHKAVIVAPNGWTEPAAKKAHHESCDLRILSIEEALELVVPDKWQMCDSCGLDCIVMDQDGMTTLPGGLILWWLAGRCRECRIALVWCQDCGMQYYVPVIESVYCDCGHQWRNADAGLEVTLGEGEVPHA
jgi:hypothetical protein